MEDEPWDELSGPPPPTHRRTHTQDAPVRASAAARHSLPPAAAFARSTSMETPLYRSHQTNRTNSSSSSSTSTGNKTRTSGTTNRTSTASRPPPAGAFGGSHAGAVSPRWSQYEADQSRDAASATAQAVYMASSAAATRESRSVASSALDDDDDDMEENGSVDSDIGRAYDMEHDSIRQEALRMLEVADADKNYSVHRTITGGFSAQAKPMGSSKPRALQGLNFVANRSAVGKKYSEYGKRSGAAARDDYEYGDESVVDVVGLGARNEQSAATDSKSSSSSWSSRYTMDKTMLGMSGGSMRQKLDRMDRHNNNNSTSSSERFSARNLFGSSPAPTPQVFGSGFSFRQQHVFGKQNATVPTDNLHWNGSPMENPRLKTWQEQLSHKRNQQRRWILAACLLAICIIVSLASVWGHQQTKELSSNMYIPADGENGSVTFYVTANGPRTTAEGEQLKTDLAQVHPTTAFSVHLGNLQDTTTCNVNHYAEVATLLEENSKAPFFVVPGADDWNNCPNPVEAWKGWHQSFKLFDRRWDLTKEEGEFEVYRQKYLMENWAFVKRGVLFLGVHVVSGVVPDQDEFDDRNDYNYRWVMGMSKEYEGRVRAVVIFGNAQPGTPMNVQFFAQVENYWRTHTTPTFYLHASVATDDDTVQYKPFQDLDHVSAAQISGGFGKPPLRVNVGLDDNPFQIGL